MDQERIKFAIRFNEVAKQLGYSGHGKQTSLAGYYSLKQPSVKKWFDGEAMPDYEICVDLCKRARCSFEWFMTGRGGKELTSEQPSVSLIYATDQEMTILTRFREANQTGKKAILNASEIAEKSPTILIGTTTNNQLK